jgi:hypothetical protein
MRSTGAFDHGRVAIRIQTPRQTRRSRIGKRSLFACCPVPGKVGLTCWLSAKIGPTAAPADPKNPICAAAPGQSEGPGVAGSGCDGGWMHRRARTVGGGLVQGRRQGSRWPPDQCDSVVFGVSSLHRREPCSALTGIRHVIRCGWASFPPRGGKSLRGRRMLTAPWRAALRPGSKRIMADNSPQTVCAPSGARVCNVPLGRLADGASSCSRSFITLTTNLTYRDLGQPIGSCAGDRLVQTVDTDYMTDLRLPCEKS